MIYNPTIGMKVFRPTLRKYATIIELPNDNSVRIRFDGIDGAIYTYSREHLEHISLDEEDRVRRERWAEKYL